MKARIIVTICISVLIIWKPAFAQKTDPNVSIDKNLLKYKNMKQGGLALIVVGGLLVVAGAAIEASQFANSMDNMFSAEPQQEYNNAGAVMFCAGAVMVGGGIPLTIIGSKKYKKYKNSPDVISLGLKSTQRSAGLSLTYRF